MGRILAIDYGEKRCGIAVTDELQLIASGLNTVSTPDLLPFLDSYIADQPVDYIVIGQPLQKDGSPSSIEPQIQGFINDFSKEHPSIPIARQDERFTSKIASKSMIASGLSKKKRRDKALIDEISATLILQSFMSRKD